MSDQQLYNSRIINTFIKLIKRKYSHVDVMELLNYAGMELYQVEDEGHWFSQNQVDLFYDHLVQITGNVHIAREAGRYAVSPEAIGFMRQYVLGMVDPANVYRMLEKATINFTRSSTYRSRKLASNRVEITVTPHAGVQEKPFQCDNRIGYFEAIALAFNCRLPEIEHTECLFRGDSVCRYTVTWKKSPAAFCKQSSMLASILLLGFCLAAPFTFATLNLFSVITGSLSLLLLFHLLSAHMEKKELKASIDNLWESSDKLLEQLSLSHNNACFTNDIAQMLSKQQNIDSILESVIQVLQKRLDYDRGMILLSNRENDKLTFRNGFGHGKEESLMLKKASFHLDRPESKGVFVLAFREKKPYLVNDFDQIKSSLSPNSIAFAKKMGAQSFIVCPIICDGESLGILVVDNLQTKKPLVQSDMNLLMGIATVIGISIRNAMLNEYREQQFSSTLQVLAASIDTRDNLTAGHAEKVTKYAVGICRELGLAQDYCEMIRVAALLHDYGKIGIPDSILKKEGRLTEEEYTQVKSHAEKTREILEQINFEGIYRQVPEIAGSHHEKIDGSGYPVGLKGQEIPFGAKIIAVADFFEAITAKRHYRDPMPLTDAVRLLEEHVGTHFEKRVVSAFLAYMRKSPDFEAENDRDPLPVVALRRRRALCIIPVVLSASGRTVAATSMDISSGGMYVAVDDEVGCGSPIELSFTLPGVGPFTFTATGKVVWVNRAGSPKKPAFPNGFGVEFLDVKPSREMIQSFVRSYQPGNGLRAGDEILEPETVYSSTGDALN